jgi:small-conductance mechanosensitive channel
VTFVLSPSAGAEETPAPVLTEVSETAVIPVAEVAVRNREVRERLREIDNALSAFEPVEGIEKSFSEQVTEIVYEQEKLEAAFAQEINPFELRSMKTLWAGMQGKLMRLEQTVDEPAGLIEAWTGEIKGLIDIWKRTKKEALRASAPGSVLKEVDATVNSLVLTEKKLREIRDTSLDLQSRIRRQLDSVDTAIERISNQQIELRRSLFVHQENPVWQMQFGTQEIKEDLSGFMEILRKERSDALKYMYIHVGQIIVRILFIAALIWLVRWTRHVLKDRGRAGKVSEEDADKGISSLDVLAYPVAAAILFGLVLNLFSLVEAPTGIRVIVYLAAIPFWLHVLSRLMPAAQITVLAGLAVLVLMNFVFSLADQYPLLSRMLLFSESVLGLMLVQVVRRSVVYRRTEQLVKGNIWFRIIDVWLKVTLFAFSVGLGASLLGYRGLAITMEGLAIWGTFAGTLLLCSVRIAEVIVQALVASVKLNRLQMMGVEPDNFLVKTRRGLRIFTFLIWIYFFLEALLLWEPLVGIVQRVLSARLGYGAVTFSLGGFIAFGLTLWVAWLLSRFVTYILDREVFIRVKMPPGVPFALTSFSRYTILVVGVLVALAMIGIPFDRLALLLSALGVGIGFGLQNVVNNFVSGIILLFERPIRVGDKVQLDQLNGIVKRIGIRASNVRTFDGADVIVPNGDFISARVINWTLSDQKRRVILPVGVAYGTDPQQVLNILESVARSHVEVLVDPSPEALFLGFGESSLDFQLRAWTDSERGWPVIQSDLAVATNDALAEAGIEIPFPQRDLHLKSVKREVSDMLSSEGKGDQGIEKEDSGE